jgi:hypothetical protein
MSLAKKEIPMNNNFTPDNIPPAETVSYGTGAIRQKTNLPRYDLIPTEPLRRLGMRYTEGAQKYAPRNWEKGMPWAETFNHLQEHLNKWKNGDEPTDDHLAAAAWGVFALMEFQRTHTELDDIHTEVL